MNIKWLIIGLLATVILAFNFCGGNQQSNTSEEVVTPTQGLVTTVAEVEEGQFKIEDEQAVDEVNASLIIAKYMDNSVDTFTLDEAKMATDSTAANSQQHHRRSSVVRMASYGLMGYMLGRNMGTYRPSSSAYVDQNTYNRVTNNAGQSIQRSASRRTVSRPGSGKSGFGKSRSTRSYGG